MKILGKMAVTVLLFAAALHLLPAQQWQKVSNPPAAGTFFLLSAESEGGSAPYPFDPYGGVMPIFQINGLPNQFLIGDSVEDFQALQSLQLEMRSGGAMAMNSLEFPGEGEEGGGGGEWTNGYSTLILGTNDLYLTIFSGSLTNAGTASLTIHNPEGDTNEPVGWFIWAATNLANCEDPWALDADNWAWVAATEPGQTNVTVPMLSDFATFYRLAHPTNDCDGDGLPDYFTFSHFGHQRGWANDASFGSNDFDSDGTSNYDEFVGVSNPNDFVATAHFSSLFVNQQTVSGFCEVQGGVPYQMAVLVNDTNVAAAIWQPYSSNFSVTLGATDGVYDVRVLWRGRTTNHPPVFDDTELTLDRVAPVLVITNPVSASATVIKPYLQLLGNANEPLAALAYDITNATGWRTNLTVSVIDQAFDTNAFDFTTNYFQAYDVALATNENQITLRVTDRAGNTTTTNLVVTLDYTGATNPPVVQLTWPPTNALVSGDGFTVRGQLDDETAQIMAQIVDGDGVTNEYSGLVERNGTFWLEGLPLMAGTNTLLLTATTAAGHSTQSSLTVIQSALALNVGGLPDGEALWESAGTVSGTVGDAGSSVSVNGMAAMVDGSGNWTAENVPINGEGTATFDVVATPPGGPSVHLSVEKEKPAIIKVTKHLMKQVVSGPYFEGGSHTITWLKDYKLWRETDGNGQSRFRYRGTASWLSSDPLGYSGVDNNWSDTNVMGTAYSFSSWSGSSTGAITDALVMSAPDQQLDHLEHDQSSTTAFYVYHYYAKGVQHEWPSESGTTVETLEARTEETLFTGGKSVIGRETLFELSGTAQDYGQPTAAPWYYTPATEVTSPRLSIMGWPLDAEGKLWALVADNSKSVLMFAAAGAKHNNGNVNQQPHKLAIKANGVMLDPDTVANGADFCVGQEINFEIVGLLNARNENDDVAVWKLTGTFVNTNSDPNCELYYEPNNALLTRRYVPDGTTSTRCWYVVGAAQATVSVDVYWRFSTATRLFKETVTGKFNVHRPVTVKATPYQPDGTPTAMILGNLLRLGNGGRSNDMSFSHTIKTDGFSAGQAGYVQVITSADWQTALPQPSLPECPALDARLGMFPRGTPDVPANTTTNVCFFDGPAIELKTVSFATCYEDVSFSTYLMFKPAGAGSIWVPLRLITWELHDEAIYDNGTWIPHTYHDGNNTRITDDKPSILFPHWTTTY